MKEVLRCGVDVDYYVISCITLVIFSVGEHVRGVFPQPFTPSIHASAQTDQEHVLILWSHLSEVFCV